jgi:GNAT superfamily N-acetyltransferase
MLTLIADARHVTVPDTDLPPGLVARSPVRTDARALGRLYFEAYDPGIACDTLDEAVDDVRATFDGAYGELWPAASWVVEQHGRLVAAVLTVRRARSADAPDCPFVVELFTDRRLRRQGLARALVCGCLGVVSATARPYLALRVDRANEPALRLYGALGFRPWTPGTQLGSGPAGSARRPRRLPP